MTTHPSDIRPQLSRLLDLVSRTRLLINECQTLRYAIMSRMIDTMKVTHDIMSFPTLLWTSLAASRRVLLSLKAFAHLLEYLLAAVRSGEHLLYARLAYVPERMFIQEAV